MVEDSKRNRILVADDDSKILEAIAFFLTREDYQVHLVGNGKDAVEAVDEFNPHLILLDVMMPEMDGFQACREINQKTGGTIPIIFLTAKRGPKNWKEADMSGASAYLEKPFKKESLLGVIREVLESTSL